MTATPWTTQHAYTCCLCGYAGTGHGNNPQPLSQNDADRCCDMCNMTRVVPARIARLAEGRNPRR